MKRPEKSLMLGIVIGAPLAVLTWLLIGALLPITAAVRVPIA